MRRDGTLLFTPRQVFLPLAGACAGGIGIIALLARDRPLAIAAAASFGVATLISLALATVLAGGESRARSVARVLCVGALGASAALPAWYFGPSSAYAGIVAINLLFAGLILGGADTPFPAGGAWAVFVGLVGGQATIAILVFTHTIRDASLLPLVPAGTVPWHHVAAHLTVLSVYVAAFAIGRALHRRYWQLSEGLDASTRTVARREALLEEARAEYRRTFALGREGVFAGHTLGRYQLGELIGRGGAGEVYRARDLIDGSLAAVKLLRADRLDDPNEIRSFLDEATVLTKLDHPNVVHTHHVGSLDEVLPYIAMEHLDGETLAQLLAKRGLLDRPALRLLIDGAASALAATHRAGVIHRDVNPTNLILVGTTWKLIDFGARAKSRGVVGTPRFVAPERLTGAPPSPAADLYSLCACIYAAATGREPFADVPPSALASIVTTQLPLDPRLHAECSNDLASALAIGLAPSPANRFADADELRRSMLAALDGTAGNALRARVDALEPWSVAPPIVATDDTSTGSASPHAAGATADALIAAVAATATAAETDSTNSSAGSDRSAARYNNRHNESHTRGPRSDGRSVHEAETELRGAPPSLSAHVVAMPAASTSEPQPTVGSGPPLSLTSGAPASGAQSIDWSAGTTTSVDVASTAWRGALADRMKLQYAYVLAACAVGALLLLSIVREPWLLGVGLGSIGAAAIVIAIEQRRALEWPWVIVATLAIGPAYVLGLHCGFAAVIVVVLFIESSFRSSEQSVLGRGWTLGAVLVTHAAAFLAIRAGVLPDAGVTPVLHHEAWSGVAIEMLVLGIFATAFMIGRATQERYAELVRRNELAAKKAANQQALLASARAEVDRVLAGFAGGLFTGSCVGAYEIGKLLGRGGMGEVYVATRDGKQVALKLIRADRVGGSTLRRFAREAEALTRVESPYVARVLDVGTEDGRLPFMAMELVQGVSLAELLREREALTASEARALVRDTARGLADVHRAGVVHRDVKPHNLVRTTVDGVSRWKLVDFGIAVIADAPRATTGNVIVGTPAYMAPEQLTGGVVDVRSDLYSLCLVMYRVLAGRPAFTAERVGKPHEPPPDPEASGVAAELCEVLRNGLTIRFASATELEATFEAAFEAWATSMSAESALATRSARESTP